MTAHGKTSHKVQKIAGKAEWEYLGIAITFDTDRARFRANVNGQSLHTASLDAMVARIDKLNLANFDAFDAYVDVHDYGERHEGKVVASARRGSGRKNMLIRVKIVALDESEGRLRYRDEFGKEWKVVYPATERTNLLWNEIQDAERDKAERIKQLDARIQESRESLIDISIHADQHKSKMRKK